MLPLWDVSPIRSANDADQPRENPEIVVDTGTPDKLRWVDRAMASMRWEYPLRALIVRTEFTVLASQAVKARMVAEECVGTLSVRQYRRELQRAVDWIGGARASAA